MRGCSGAAQRAACCVHSCHRIRRCGGAGNCRIKHDRGFCRVHELLALPRLVFRWPDGVYALSRCVGATALLSGARAVCTAATGFAGMTALAIAESSTTEAFAARTSCLLCRSLFSCGPVVFAHDNDAWVQRRCPAGCMLCAQLPPDSQVWRRWQLPNQARPRLLPRTRAFDCCTACMRLQLHYFKAIAICACGNLARQGVCSVHSCVTGCALAATALAIAGSARPRLLPRAQVGRTCAACMRGGLR